MVDVFAQLARRESFLESDFQRLFHELSPKIALLDKGLFTSLTGPGSKVAMSWPTTATRQLGYVPSREGVIYDPSEYNIVRLV